MECGNPNRDPWSESERPEWRCYSDIEEAFVKKQPRATLDKYSIDLNSNMKTDNNDHSKQRHVQRLEHKPKDVQLREVRFMDLSTTSDRAFGGQYGFLSLFVIEGAETKRKREAENWLLENKNEGTKQV
jgi:hypothetical protein